MRNALLENVSKFKLSTSGYVAGVTWSKPDQFLISYGGFIYLLYLFNTLTSLLQIRLTVCPATVFR